MSKEKKKKGKGKTERGKKLNLIAICAIVVSVSVAAGFMLTTGGAISLPKALGGEMRKPLSSRYFLGKTASAYKTAAEIPQVLDKTYCYCKCQENSGHKSLLTCFADRHGSQCGICIDEALMARDLYRKGYKTANIVEKIDSYFSKWLKK